MSASNRGIIAVVGAGVLAGAGIAIYLAFVAGPADDARAVRAEIEQWEATKWSPVRACLLGDDDRGLTARDALLVRWATTPALIDETACLSLFHDLARPKTDASGSPEVERAWRDLSAAMGLLSNRYALLAPGDDEGLGPVADALAAADQATDALRAAAGMEPAVRGRSTARSLGTITTLAGRSSISVAPGVIDVRPAATDLPGTVTRLGADAPITATTAPHVVRAVPTLRWGAWTERLSNGDVELYAGPVNDDGTAGQGARVGVIGPGSDDGAIQLALDGGAHRAIVFTVGGIYRPLVTIASSSDGGASWTVAAPLQTVGYHANAAAGRVDLMAANEQGEIVWLGLAAGHLADARPVVTSVGQVLGACATADSLWLIDDDRLYVADAPGQIVGPVGPSPGNALIACDDDVAVFRGFQRTVRCTREACDKNGAPATNVSSVAAAVADGAPLIATTLQDLLLVWTRGAAQPAIYRLPSPHLRVAAIARWGDRTRALLTRELESGYSLVELPATAAAP